MALVNLRRFNVRDLKSLLAQRLDWLNFCFNFSSIIVKFSISCELHESIQHRRVSNGRLFVTGRRIL